VEKSLAERLNVVRVLLIATPYNPTNWIQKVFLQIFILFVLGTIKIEEQEKIKPRLVCSRTRENFHYIFGTFRQGFWFRLFVV